MMNNHYIMQRITLILEDIKLAINEFYECQKEECPSGQPSRGAT